VRRTILVLLLLGSTLAATPARAARLKDIARLQGVRDNQLGGYGLVVGLKSTGDRRQATFTLQSLLSMLARNGIRVDGSEVRVRNVAAVMVTATLPPFARNGDKLDVQVSSIGDADSLQGGTLLLTPLKGPDGKVYAVAQGPLSVGGFSASGATGTSVRKNHDTAGTIPNGAVVEREVPTVVRDRDQLSWVLDRPDFTTASRVAAAIDGELAPKEEPKRKKAEAAAKGPGGDAPAAADEVEGKKDGKSKKGKKGGKEPKGGKGKADLPPGGAGDADAAPPAKRAAAPPPPGAPAAEPPRFATVVDGATVSVQVPPDYRERVPELVARLEHVQVKTDRIARVVLNERTGTVVMGADVRISTVAIAQGGLTVTIRERLTASQPGPFSSGETVVLPESDVEVEEEEAGLQVLKGGTSLGALVKALNALGVTPRDLVSILQALEVAGALEAKLEVI